MEDVLWCHIKKAGRTVYLKFRVQSMLRVTSHITRELQLMLTRKINLSGMYRCHHHIYSTVDQTFQDLGHAV